MCKLMGLIAKGTLTLHKYTEEELCRPSLLVLEPLNALHEICHPQITPIAKMVPSASGVSVSDARVHLDRAANSHEIKNNNDIELIVNHSHHHHHHHHHHSHHRHLSPYSAIRGNTLTS
jgi:hypothetical protein